MRTIYEKGGGILDDNLRCKCGKIVCQLQDHVVVIRCRHCKREIILEFNKPEGQGKDTTPRQQRPKIEYR